MNNRQRRELTTIEVSVASRHRHIDRITRSLFPFQSVEIELLLVLLRNELVQLPDPPPPTTNDRKRCRKNFLMERLNKRKAWVYAQQRRQDDYLSIEGPICLVSLKCDV